MSGGCDGVIWARFIPHCFNVVRIAFAAVQKAKALSLWYVWSSPIARVWINRIW